MKLTELKPCEMSSRKMYNKQHYRIRCSREPTHLPVCTVCGDAEAKNFHKKNDSRTGYRSRCKSCRADAAALYRAKNRDKIAAYNKEYYRHNRDAIIEKNRKYRARFCSLDNRWEDGCDNDHILAQVCDFQAEISLEDLYSELPDSQVAICEAYASGDISDISDDVIREIRRNLEL